MKTIAVLLPDDASAPALWQAWCENQVVISVSPQSRVAHIVINGEEWEARGISQPEAVRGLTLAKVTVPGPGVSREFLQTALAQVR